MGRKPKTMEDYVHEYEDFKVLCEGANKRLVCKCCRLSISGDPHHISSRLNEHVKSARHLQLKKPRTELVVSGSPAQMTLAQSVTRFAEKHKTGEDIAHEFCRSVCQGGVALLH